MIIRRKAIVPIDARILLRHAHAGSRSAWIGADEWRGLTPLGHSQAAELSRRLADRPILRVLSSPSLRCRQTVVPVARELGVDVELCRELSLDAGGPELARFLAEPESDGALLCTHRETLEALFAHLASAGAVDLGGPQPSGPMEYAAAWILHGAGPVPGARLRYLSTGPSRVGPSPVGVGGTGVAPARPTYSAASSPPASRPAAGWKATG
jgi:phosphohistidine phosphatase SixA